jgi:poly [ADP-ribose] polymerase
MKPKQFAGQTFCLDLSYSTPYKQKKSLIDTIINHGGRVSFVLNKKVTCLIKNDPANVDTYKCRSAFKLGVPVLNFNYISDSLDKPQATLNQKNYLIQNKLDNESFQKGILPKSRRF